MRRLEWQKSDQKYEETYHVLLLLDTAGGSCLDGDVLDVVQSTDSIGLLQCVAKHLYDDTGTYEYMHYGPEIPRVLRYPHMRLEDAKVAALTTVRLCCDLEVGNE